MLIIYTVLPQFKIKILLYFRVYLERTQSTNRTLKGKYANNREDICSFGIHLSSMEQNY